MCPQSAALSGVARFDALDARFLGAERYEFLRELREADPPLGMDQFGRVCLLRYEHVHAGYTDHHTFRNIGTGFVEALGCTGGPLFEWQSHALIVQNPPRHTAMRKAVRRINARMAKRLAPVIEQSAHTLVDSFPKDGVVDFAKSFAFTLPVSVIMGLLHLPEEDTPLIAELSPHTLPAGPDDIEVCQQANTRFRAYVEERIRERREQALPEDVLSDLIAEQDQGNISSDELWATVQTLILAGHETTSSALTAGLYVLLQNPEQWAALDADRSLLGNAAEEILRWDSPVENMPRVLASDVEIGGINVPQGTLVNLSSASANRDPREFPEPDVFDVHRPNARSQLAFGAGIHRCTGAPLAQVEIPIALGVLLDRLDHVETLEAPTYAPGFFRQIDPLPLHVTTRPRPATAGDADH